MMLEARRFRSRRVRGLFGGAVLVATTLAACGPDAANGTPRPTDPRVILTSAITATAALPALRLHAEIAANMGAVMGGPANAMMTAVVDADIDLATRQLAGRATSSTAANPGGNGAGGQHSVSDIIVTRNATFNRDSQTGRWTKLPSGIGGAGPTNAEVATMISNLLSNPAMTFDLQDATPCSLGMCDHVIAHLDGPTLVNAVGALFGAPADANAGLAVPNFDVDVRVDQSSGVISEVRTSISMAGTSEQILVTVSNPGQPVQITAPPAALTDDLGANFGGGFGPGSGIATPMPLGPEESMILEQVGNELESALPVEPAPSGP